MKLKPMVMAAGALLLVYLCCGVLYVASSFVKSAPLSDKHSYISTDNVLERGLCSVFHPFLLVYSQITGRRFLISSSGRLETI
jgi:hypothetical protein